MSKAKKLKKAQKRWRKAWRKQAARSERAHARAVAKAAPADPFDGYLQKRAATGDVTARVLLQKRGYAASYTYRNYLERTLRTATSAEVRSGVAAQLARLDGDVPPAPPAQGAKWRITAW